MFSDAVHVSQLCCAVFVLCAHEARQGEKENKDFHSTSLLVLSCFIHSTLPCRETKLPAWTGPSVPPSFLGQRVGRGRLHGGGSAGGLDGGGIGFLAPPPPASAREGAEA